LTRIVFISAATIRRAPFCVFVKTLQYFHCLRRHRGNTALNFHGNSVELLYIKSIVAGNKFACNNDAEGTCVPQQYKSGETNVTQCYVNVQCLSCFLFISSACNYLMFLLTRMRSSTSCCLMRV